MKILVIGATGGIGGAVAGAFAGAGLSKGAGHEVWALHRDPDKAKRVMAHAPWVSRLNWIKGDAMVPADVARAAEGMDILFHGANPPDYKKWEALALPMLTSSIEAAKESGAHLFFPGNIYNFGPRAWPVLHEEDPQKPRTRRGKIRVRMEGLLEAAAGEGARVLILRAGDFFGPHAPGSWFGSLMVKPGKRVRSVTYPGAPEVGHAWAYLPDMAEAFLRIAERRDDLADFERFHFGGHYLARGAEMAEMILKVAGRPDGRIKKAPWGAIRLLSPFNETFAGLMEMRYLWRKDIGLSNEKLVGFLGAEPHTPLEEAVRASLEGHGCL